MDASFLSTLMPCVPLAPSFQVLAEAWEQRPPARPFRLAYVIPALLECEVLPIRVPQALGGQLS